MAKRSSIRSIIGKRLSDVTNLQTTKVSKQDENSLENFQSNKDFIDALIKENMTLTKLIAERNKIIELSGVELHNLRVSYQKLQMQNWHLAQSNSRMLAELNQGKEKLRTLQHEIVCKDSLLKAKYFELEAQTTDNSGFGKAGNGNSRRSQSMAPSTTCQSVADKEKIETKRQCLRRQSAKFKTHEREKAENLFEIEDAKFPESRSLDTAMEEDGAAMVKSFAGKEEKENMYQKKQRAESMATLPRSSLGRPLRKAAEKVQTYKEVPLNLKMRRKEDQA